MAKKPPPAPANPASPPRAGSLVSAEWSGPLPPPGALSQFNDIIPDGAERIMKLVEVEQAHRIAMDRRSFRAEVADVIGGKILGGVITLVAIAAAVYLAILGHTAVAIAVVSVPVTALIGKFVTKS